MAYVFLFTLHCYIGSHCAKQFWCSSSKFRIFSATFLNFVVYGLIHYSNLLHHKLLHLQHVVVKTHFYLIQYQNVIFTCRSHMKCATYIVFDSFEATATAGSKTCARIFVWDLVPSILHISWVVLEYSSNFGPNCSRFHQILFFALFSQSILVIPLKLGKDIVRGTFTLSANLISNGLDLGNWQTF